jgi:hypothetical protein
LLLAGCQTTQPLYYWGDYEGSVERIASEQNDFDLQAEIDVLETDLEKAQNNDRWVPPGYHIHLGYLLYLRGDLGSAVRQFEAEKARYPESEQFVDGLLARIAPAPVTTP